MSFPASPANLTNQESIQAILEAEAGIIDCMAEFWGAAGGVVSMIQAETDLAKQLELFNTILPSYANKENSIARVIEGAAKNLAADKNINPEQINCPPCESKGCCC